MSDEPNLSLTQEDVQAVVQRLEQEADLQANGDAEQEALVLALPQILEEYWQE